MGNKKDLIESATTTPVEDVGVTPITVTEIAGCRKKFKDVEEVTHGFDADEICMSCANIKYKDGVISCQFAKVN